MKDKERQRKEAINRLHMLHTMLGIDRASMTGFEKGNIPLSVELFLGFSVITINLLDVPDFERKVKRFEEKHNCTIYYVINTCNVFLVELHRGLGL